MVSYNGTMSALQMAISFASLFVAIALPAIAAAFYFGQRLARIEERAAFYSNYLSSVGKAVGALAAASPDPAVRSETMRVLAVGIHAPRAPDNPFSHEEAARYNRFVQMAENGETFTPDQVRDFNMLIERYREEHPNDPASTGLLILGAFLVGLYLLGRKDQ